MLRQINSGLFQRLALSKDKKFVIRDLQFQGNFSYRKNIDIMDFILLTDIGDVRRFFSRNIRNKFEL